MKKISLNGKWNLEGGGYKTDGTIPGSVYSFLLDAGLMEDPFHRDNELKSIAIMDNEFTFSRTFEFSSDNEILLHCDGIDTLCDIYINGYCIAHVDNMHRTWEFPITEYLKTGENEIKLIFPPLDAYIKKLQKEKFIYNQPDCTAGSSHIRKAQCMMGWDWGARLPDAGIWRDIYLIEKNSARITDFHITQRHENGKVFITPSVSSDAKTDIIVTLTDPSGNEIQIEANKETEVLSPLLWWPNGMGEQNLYTLKAEIFSEGEICDSIEKRIGLRTLTLVREKDKWGESFCHEVNGIKFFAMGADYIPEDNVLSRITPERTKRLMEVCIDSNFNTIRVWGGGYYPDDFFFDICDELGLVVFQDMMFACCSQNDDEDFIENVKVEFYDNLKRMRHHACLGIICGNNEIEWGIREENKETYLRYFEDILPEICGEICPYIPYIPSSPTTCGHFIDPNNENYGDCHYWEVWHNNKPFTEYRKHYFRYLSEFGFQSFPCEKTVNSFTLPEDRNIFSRVMEMHQRNGSANGKILSYLSDTYRYPRDFGVLLYTSQLLQAEAIKYGVEHFRRNRGRCMGTLYWQLNDIWPVASWASIDYYERYKALQYYAKRFYSPVLLSCMETGERTTRFKVNAERTVGFETKAQFVVTNDTLKEFCGEIEWELRNTDGEILHNGKHSVTVSAQSVLALPEKDFEKTDVSNNYLCYRLMQNGEVLSEETVLFTAPKHFNFKDPALRCEICGDEITVFADKYAKSVEIDSPDSDFVLSDNFFDMNPGKKTVKIKKGMPKTISLRSVYDIR